MFRESDSGSFVYAIFCHYKADRLRALLEANAFVLLLKKHGMYKFFLTGLERKKRKNFIYLLHTIHDLMVTTASRYWYNRTGGGHKFRTMTTQCSKIRIYTVLGR